MKYSDVVATFALLVSFGTLVASQMQNRATQIDATRPRLKLQLSAARGGAVSLDGDAARMEFQVTATNFGTTPARDVRSVARTLRTNSAHFAFNQFRAFTMCQFPGATNIANLYPGQSTTVFYNLGARDGPSYMNPTPFYKDGNVEFWNSALSVVVAACVTYRMDGVSSPFTESLVYYVRARCGTPPNPCDITGGRPPDATSVEFGLYDIE